MPTLKSFVTKALLTGTTLVLGVATASASPVIIDSFGPGTSGGVFDSTPGNGGVTGAPGLSTSAIGGEREYFANFTVGTAGSTGPGGGLNGVGTDVDSGIARFTTQSTVPSGRGFATITYDGPGSTGLGGVDLTDGGTNTGIAFDVVNVVGKLMLSVILRDTAGNMLTLMADIMSPPATGQSFFLSFLGGAASGGDAQSIASDVDSIVLRFDNTDPSSFADSDINIDNLRATGPAVVPEPGSVALLAMGLIGLLGYGVRRRMSQARVV